MTSNEQQISGLLDDGDMQMECDDKKAVQSHLQTEATLLGLRVDDELAGKVLASIHQRQHLSIMAAVQLRSKQPRKHAWTWVAAALILCACTLWAALNLPSSVRILSTDAGAHASYTADGSLHLRTDTNALAHLQAAHGSIVTVHENAVLTVTPNGKKVTLAQGKIDLSVQKQHDGPLHVNTPHGTVNILGTRLTTDVRIAGTLVSVAQGAVTISQTQQTDIAVSAGTSLWMDKHNSHALGLLHDDMPQQPEQHIWSANLTTIPEHRRLVVNDLPNIPFVYSAPFAAEGQYRSCAFDTKDEPLWAADRSQIMTITLRVDHPGTVILKCKSNKITIQAQELAVLYSFSVPEEHVNCWVTYRIPLTRFVRMNAVSKGKSLDERTDWQAGPCNHVTAHSREDMNLALARLWITQP